MRGKTISIYSLISIVGSIGLLSMTGHANRNDDVARGQIGADVVAWTIGGENGYDFIYRGSSDGIGGYSMATQSCNWGDEVLNWYGGTNNTPIIMQNMYRIKNGVMQQIGLQSFMKHSFCALSEHGCGACQSTDCDTLGIGCADTYGAGLNSGGNCPRSDVNGFTGYYPYPFSISPTGPSVLRGNLQIANVDVDPGYNASARYFIEAQYVAADDMAAGNGHNNASWREIIFNSVSSTSPVSNGPSATHPGESAIEAWAGIDSSVDLNVQFAPNDGKIIVGVKVIDNGNGSYEYHYAVYNMNCDRSIGSISIPTTGEIVSNLGFHDVNYSSAEIYSGTDWNGTAYLDFVTWDTQTYSQNQNANAIRWGTMYNFNFTSLSPPVEGSIDLGLFKPNGPSIFAVNALVPEGGLVDPCDQPIGNCPEDADGDNTVAVGDLLKVIATFNECGDGTYRPEGDVTGDCCVNVTDILAVIQAWGNDCTPIGSCCLPVGDCSEGSYLECDQNGGTYQGDGSNCKNADCFVSGDGDECNSAMTASLGSNAFETNTATPSSNPPSDSQCESTWFAWQNSQDIWFRYVPLASGSTRFTTCDSLSYDTSIALYEGLCDYQIACNGDSDGSTGCQQYYSEITYNLSAGTTYYIRIGGYQGETGSGTLTIN